MKKIVIVSMSSGAARQYADSILDVFRNKEITVETTIIGETVIPRDADLYLVSKGYIESRIGAALHSKLDFPVGIPVIDLVVEFRKEDVRPLFALKKGTHCLLVNATEMLAMECISDLYNVMGIYHLAMFPYSDDSRFYDETIQTAITIGEPELVPACIQKVIDLGVRWISPETMVEIALNLKMEDVLETEAFTKYRRQFNDGATKVSDLIAGSSYYKNIFHFMIECLDDGILGVNQEKKIFCANKKAEEILGIKAEALLGTDFQKAMPFFEEQNQKTDEESFNFLTRYNGVALQIFLNPLTHMGKFKGFLIVIKRFFEQEQKQNRARLQLFERGYRAKYKFDDLIGESEKLKKVCQMAKKMAMSDSTILITGETGTGKELLASAIHNASLRKEEAYIAINCSAMSDHLLESELFGYDEGAFTGAKKSGKLGLFEYAHRGTLFLDEIEDMSPALQLKLLRVLQEKEIMHIGGDRIIKVDVRIIAATNRNLEELVRQGKIRKDLFYRLNTLQLEIPPLRERREDILPLLHHFLKKYHSDVRLDDNVVKTLLSHEWEGNVRELQNCAEFFACIQKDSIQLDDLPKSLRKHKNNIGEISEESDAVLRILYENYRKQQHIGRKVLSETLWQRGIFLSEQQVRSILAKLEANHMVIVSKGRGGTRLTPTGAAFCEAKGINFF